MSDGKSLEQKIIEELEKTGFPTEIVTADLLRQHGYGVLHNPSYLDDIQKISREFDIRAYKSWHFDKMGLSWSVAVYLCVECKKSKSSWVFFMSPDNHKTREQSMTRDEIHTDKESLGKIGPINDFGDVAPESSLDGISLLEYHHYYSLPYRARTYFEPLKQKDQTTVGQSIYSAVMSCTKAVLFSSGEKRYDRHVKFFYPVVIFDGDMFEAHVASDKTISLVTTQHVQLSHHYLTATRGRSPLNSDEFIVDVVRDDYLPNFLGIIEQEMEMLRDALRDGIAQ
jgi:hypothetical protein